ncbi:MAG TPA: GNAT family N-acetyltransferase [Polyangiaceae bacterium]|jgi:ribosomal-protein-alanine N-acetyltransferase|nr:GNAT family N-acetyltransferase [Polyangiaceae bacterium]
MVVESLASDGAEAVREIARSSDANIDVEAELGRPWARLWVARVAPGEPPLGFLLAWVVADELHLIHVATHPNGRRRGAARALMSELLAHGASVQTRLVLLEVRRSNRPAIRLYRGFGFTAMGVRRDYYPNGEDAIEMRLTLDPTTGKIIPGRDEVSVPET